MVRPTRTNLGVLACVAWLLAGCGGRATPARANLLLVTLDTTRADRLGAYGYEDARTPVLDALAAEGTVFEQAYSPAPMTLPAHATLLTGLLPPQHGARVNGVHVLDPELVTVAERLAAKGYRTAAFVAAFVLSRRFGLDQGFEVFDDDLGGAYEQEVASPLARYRPGNLVVDEALAWLERTKDLEQDRPFFAWVHLYDAHFPWHPHDAGVAANAQGADGAPAAEQEGTYDGEVAFADAQVGRLRTWLAENGLADRTLLCVIADHGEGLGDHHEIEHAYLLNEEVLHIPWFLVGPGVPAGARIGTLVSTEDVAPTLFELLGVPSTGMDGRSLVPALRGETLEDEDAYAETDLPWTSYRWAPQRSLTTTDWKYVRTPQTELYDRASDRAEYANLAETRPEVVAELEARLRALEDRLGSRESLAAELYDQDRDALAALGYAAGADTAGPSAEAASTAPDMKERLAMKDLAAELRQGLAKETIPPAQHVEIARRLVEGAPETPSFRNELGEALLRAGDREGAVEAFERAVEMAPEDAGLHYSLGDTLQQLGRADEARPHIELALKLAPMMAQAHVAMGNIQRDEGRSDLAAGEYSEALRLQPDYPEAHYNLAMTFLDRGLPERARAELERALEQREDWDVAHRALANLALQEGRVPAAIEHLRACLPALDGDPGLHVDLGLALRRARQPQAAAEEFDAAIRAAPQDPRGHLARANLAFDYGNEAVAIEHYRAGLLGAPDDLDAGARLARLLATAKDASLRDPELAVALAEHAAEVTSRQAPRILEILALAYAAADRPDDARAAASEALPLARGQGLPDLVQRLQRMLAAAAGADGNGG